MSNYNIYVTNNNNTGNAQTYYLICENPTITSSYDISPRPYSAIYIASVPIQGDGSTYTFSFGFDIFACCGYQQLQNGTIISTIDNTPMYMNGIQDNIANMIIANGGPGFAVSSVGPKAGTFEITVPDYDSTKYRKSLDIKCFRLWLHWHRTNSLLPFQPRSGVVLVGQTLFIAPPRRRVVQIMLCLESEPVLAGQHNLVQIRLPLTLYSSWPRETSKRDK